MLFNSLEFALFLPLVFIGYWFLFNRSIKLQNIFLIVAGCVFYGWWDWRFLILFGLTSLLCYYSSIYIYKFQDTRKAYWISAINITINLLILGVFKYYNFFTQSFVDFMAALGFNLHRSMIHVILPVGVSFYTFQALSYSIDVYRKKIIPTSDWTAFFAYHSFFPQLVAGPIERATHLLPQFYKARQFNYTLASDGLRQMLWGFFKKIVIADNCAIAVNHIFDNYETLPASSLWIGALLFTFQIYCDFSGYSDIAIGCAKLFGIDLMKNFNFPYFSRDIAEFWRRWHISLTTWFRDYIYIPLGGSRGGKWLSVRNTMVIFLVSGLWHGANWTFVIWGVYHALLFLPLLLKAKNRKYTNQVAEESLWPNLKEFIQMGSTVLLVLIGWVIFRAENLTQMTGYLKNMFAVDFFTNPFVYESLWTRLSIFPLLVVFVIIEWFARHKDHPFAWESYHVGVRWSLFVAVALVIFLFGGVQGSFIYFQF